MLFRFGSWIKPEESGWPVQIVLVPGSHSDFWRISFSLAVYFPFSYPAIRLTYTLLSHTTNPYLHSLIRTRPFPLPDLVLFNPLLVALLA